MSGPDPLSEDERFDLLQIGDVVDKYRVEAHLGTGGLAAIYRARHIHLGTIHALKLPLIATPIERARLLAEGRAQAALRHPNIVAVTDVLMINRAPALILELIEGPSLAQRLAAGPIEPELAISLFQGIVTGVGAAHAAGLVHRDLKPANILLHRETAGRDPAGKLTAKITDFGLVRSLHAGGVGTLSGSAVGTPAYMSPEQIRDPSHVDTRTDLWSLGAILYEITHGRRAFSEEDPFALYQAISAGRHGAIDPDRVDARTRAAIEGLLVLEPEQRISSCTRLWELLWGEPVPSEFIFDTRLSFTPVDTIPGAATISRPAPPPPSRLRLVLLAALAAAAIAALAILSSAVLLWVATQLALPGPDPQRELPAPIAPSEIAPSEIAPSVLAPAPEQPPVEIVPAPIRAPIERPETRIAPAPASSEPPALPSPSEPPEELGTLTVGGDADVLWLESSGQRFETSGPIPAGSYRMIARFGPDNERFVGTIQIRAGEQAHVRCTSALFACARTDLGAPLR